MLACVPQPFIANHIDVPTYAAVDRSLQALCSSLQSVFLVLLINFLVDIRAQSNLFGRPLIPSIRNTKQCNKEMPRRGVAPLGLTTP